MSSIWARLKGIWPWGKNHLWSTCYSFEKKNSRLLNKFSRLNLNVQDFFQVWKIVGQISRIQDSVRTLKRTKMQRELTSAGGIRYDGNKFCSIHKTVPLWYNAIENTTFNVQLYSNNSLKIVVFKEAILQLQAIALCGLSCHSEREKYWGKKRRSEAGLLPEFTAYIRVFFRLRVRL